MEDRYMYDDYAPDALGFAELLVAVHPDKLRYAVDINRFYKYDGIAWRQCNQQNVGIGEVIDNVSRHFAVKRDKIGLKKPKDDNPEYTRWMRFDTYATIGGSSRSTSEVITKLKDRPEIRCHLNDFSQKPYLLNFRNGTLHLNASRVVEVDGELVEEANFRRHDPKDMLATVLDRDYQEYGNGYAPLWDSLLMHMCGGDKSLARNLEEALAYGLYGANPEQLMVFVVGDASIGKTQLLEIVAELAGTLGGHGKIELIRKVSGQEHDSIRADLRGKHFVMLGESSLKLKLDDLKFKDLIGSRSLPTRKLGQEPVDTRVTWTLYAATNELPEISGEMDDAVARRLWVFNLPGKQIPKAERDTHLTEKIVESEGEMILYRMARHLSEWFGPDQKPVQQHIQCTMALDNYRTESDTVSEFIQAQMRSENGTTVTYDEVHKAYMEFCKARGLSPVSRKFLPRRIEQITGWERDSSNCRFRNAALAYEAPSWVG